MTCSKSSGFLVGPPSNSYEINVSVLSLFQSHRNWKKSLGITKRKRKLKFYHSIFINSSRKQKKCKFDDDTSSLDTFPPQPVRYPKTRWYIPSPYVNVHLLILTHGHILDGLRPIFYILEVGLIIEILYFLII